MKKWYILGIVLVLSVLLCCIFYLRKKEKNELTSYTFRILGLSIAASVVYLSVMLSSVERVSLIAYSLYFIVIDWFLYYLLKFSITYTGHKFNLHVKRKPMLCLIWLDVIVLLLNIRFAFLFVVHKVIVSEHYVYCILEIKQGFLFHIIFSCFLLCCSMACLLYKAQKTATLYRKKYIVIFVIMSFILLENICMLLFRNVINFSVFGYVGAAVAIYYCAFVYLPRGLKSKAIFKISDNMSSAIILMDAQGNIVYTNKKATIWMQKEKQIINRRRKSLGDYLYHLYRYKIEGITKPTFFENGQELYLQVETHRLFDKKETPEGTFFILHDYTEEIRHRQKERYQATHDAVTGLYNKEYFFEQATQCLKENLDETYMVICSDIRNFKMVNDVFGTKCGDEILKRIAETIRQYAKEGAKFGHLGNDRFAVLMPKSRYNEKIFIDLPKEVVQVREDNSYLLTVCVGVYEVQDHFLPISVMCDRAQMALSTIKEDYQKSIAYYDDKLRNAMLREQELISDLEEALGTGQIRMYLQPQLDANGSLLGAEALVRWIHPEKGMISPAEFLPVFEKNGMISRIDRYIWEQACIQLKKWKEEGREQYHISVNISPKDLYLLDIYQIFVELVEQYEIAPKQLKLEITETAVMMNLKRQLKLIKKLKDAGFIVEMDDFGSGYSSLNMLKDINVDILKIDMAFLEQTENAVRGEKILRAIIDMSLQLGMPVISEGVETAEQLAMLIGMGCNMFQGYYFAKPMSVEEFTERYFRDEFVQ